MKQIRQRLRPWARAYSMILALAYMVACSTHSKCAKDLPRDELQKVRRDLAYYSEFLSVVAKGEWPSTNRRVYTLSLEIKNTGPELIEACIGENSHYEIRTLTYPHLSRWPVTVTKTDHPVCLYDETATDLMKFELGPGENYSWAVSITLPKEFEGESIGSARVQIMQPTNCRCHGCYAITKGAETQQGFISSLRD